MSCRYPGANTLDEFWNLLYAGEEALGEPPAFRWTKEHTLKVTPQDRRTQAGFLSVPVDEFDAGFFGVSPKEAAYMDPQTRLLHEVMWESLEDAGINPQSLYGTHAGIFTGSWMQDYKEIVQGSAEKDFFRTYLGNGIGAAAARLSHFLGLTGPSVATESGCSSAIVALDLAVKSLRKGETHLALVGGVNLLLNPFATNMMEFVLSRDFRCKTFDASADGFARAEGCGVLVLKRLSDALRDRDNIWAVIRGSAISQEGLSRSLGTPTVHCEALAMKLALEDAGVNPEQVSFVETHGTGTPVGDPMEVAAIAKAYYSPKRKEPLVIGSVKTNVGHTESCSGITGIMKAVLAMQHELIPKHRNLQTLNPEIFLDAIPAIIPMENVPWPKVQGQPRICGVSSFGITGTDGHVILEEAPNCDLPKFTRGRPMHLMTISGKSNDALNELIREHRNLFASQDENGEGNFADAAYTANVGRAKLDNRAFVVASSYQDALQALEENRIVRGESIDGSRSQIGFLFTGQGSQCPGMARMLYETSPVFAINFDACDRTLRENYNLSIREVLWESATNSKELSRTIYSQTSIFCVEYCLFKLWQSWGIKPDYVLGHSLGEFCAAVAVGVLTFEDALRLVAERSRLIDNLPRGSMLVIKASKPEVENWMKAAKIDLDFAALNSPEQTVVAGDTKTVETFMSYLKGQGTKAIILEATHAFHSRHMDSMLEEYRKVAESINYRPGNPSIQYVSGMKGGLIDDVTKLNADYWVHHTREKVSFLDACGTLMESGCTTFLEIGPQPVLSSFVLSNIEDVPLNCLPSLRKGTETILTSLGKLYLLGYQVDWKGYDEPYTRKKMSLPFHPFHRKSFWVECSSNTASIIHPLLGSQINNASALSIFQNDLKPKSVPYLKDHCIGNRIIFPGAGFTEISLSAGYCTANGFTENLEPPTQALRLSNLRIEAPLELKEDKACHFQVIVDLPEGSTETSGFRVKVFHQNTLSSEESGKWVLHASASYVPVANTKDCMKLWNPTRLQDIIAKNEQRSTNKFYKRIDDAGLKFGDTFRTLLRYWAIKQQNHNMDDVVAEIQVPHDNQKYLLHPLVIDAAFQMGFLAVQNYAPNKLKVPITLEGLTLFPGAISDNTESLYLHLTSENGKLVLFICTKDNLTPVACLENFELMDTSVATIEAVLEQQSSPIPDVWEETWKPIPGPFDNQVAQGKEFGCLHFEPEFWQEVTALGQNSQVEKELYGKLKRLIYLYILNACQKLGWKPQVDQKIGLTSFCSTLGISNEHRKLVRFYLTVFEEDAGLLSYLEDDQWVVKMAPPRNCEVTLEINQLLKNLKGADSYADIITILENVAENLAEVLTGQKSALQLLFPENERDFRFSADAFYQYHPRKENFFETLKLLMNTQFQKSQAMDLEQNGGKGVYRVLEVGSGTGSLSGPMLTWLKNVWGTRFEMWYTDISKGFFTKAEQKLQEFRENIKLEVFNIEQGPLGQGIPLGYFDMVCATDVLHATRDLEETLVHLRQTLRPGGVLCFTETVIPSRDITFVFGLLEGYWRYEDLDIRPHHCCGGDKVWENALNKTGYRDFNCFKVFMDEFACMIAVAEPQLPIETLVPTGSGKVETRPVWVLFAASANTELSVKMTNTLVACGNRVILGCRGSGTSAMEVNLTEGVSLKTFELHEDPRARIEALLAESNVEGVIYACGMNKNERNQENVALSFLHIAKIMVALEKPPKLFVVTQGVHPVTEDGVTGNASAATLFGMAKSLKNERFDLFVRCVELEQGASVEEHLRQVLYELAMFKWSTEVNRLQVSYRGGMRYEPRLCKARLPMAKDELKLPPSTDRYHLRLPTSRMIQDLEFEPLDVGTFGETEVEIRTKAYSLNFKDILTILKPSAEFEKLNAVGLDFAGVVTKAGEKAKWKVGDRVFGSNFKEAQLPSHLVLESEHVVGIPENMTFTEAATLPAVFLTAYYCLMNVAKMKKGDKVLIHTGSGGVGLAAIQLGKMVGAEIITTAGNPRKRAYLRGLGIQHVFKSRDTSYEQDILRVTNGQGVDIVLNSITGPGIKEATLRATAKNGRFVEMSKLSTWTPEEVKEIRPDVDYSIVDLTVVDQKTHKHLLERMHQYLSDGAMKAIPFVKFDALRIRQALQYFQKAKHIGKVVVTIPEVSTRQGQYMTKVPLFNSESTYLITGGLGGIGFEVCKWMMKLGAADVVLTGRRPPASEIMQQINKLQAEGYNVQVKLGDIGNPEQCHALIGEINRLGKPLRGVMHSAGVLRDNLYSSQTWSAFEATFNPKVKGTWNLHECTKNLPLEHFVVYSSVTALIGTPGQPNHAASNCFEDAFIHYRHSLGLPGLSINWGQWSQVGCAKDINIQCFVPVSVTRMLNGLEVALRQEKRQVAFVDFASINNLTTFCPTTRYYLDDKVIKKLGTEDTGQAPQAEQFWTEIDQYKKQVEKIDVLTGYLKKILCAALRVDKDEKLNEKANLQELGVDSLMMIELKNSIQNLLGGRATVTANLLKNCTTIQQISEAVVGKIFEGQGIQEDLALEPLDPAELLELLRSDAQLPQGVQVAPGTTPAVRANQIKTVLVTGATGELGAYLVTEICKFVDRIVCLVRGTPDDGKALEILRAHFQKLELNESVNWSKIEVVIGNVAMKNLGIAADRYAELCQNVDAVIHCAARTSLLEHLRPSSKNGEDIRSVNILGTGNVLKFACSEKVKHMFYPSTIFCGIASQTANTRLSDEWPEVGVIQTIVDHQLPGLLASKWIGELLMKQANERGIPGKVFRFPVLAGHSKTGRTDTKTNLNVQRFLKFLKLGAVPDVAVPATALPVDICAKVALKLFINENVPNEVFNVTRSRPQMETEFAQMAHQKFGKKLEVLSWSKFAERLRDSNVISDVNQNEAIFSKLYKDAFQSATSYAENSDSYFRNDKVERCFPNYDKEFPSSMETIAKDLEFVRSNELMTDLQF